MKSFFVNIVSSFIGVFLASIAIGFVIIISLIGLITTIADSFDSSASLQKLNEPSVLILRLDYPIHEKTSEDPFDHYDFRTMESRVVLGLDDIVESIHRAKFDPNISGIYLNLAPHSQGWATAEAIRTALLDFRREGKWITSYNELYSHQSYYISSVANDIFLNPEGYMEFQGLSAQSIFLKETLEKLDIEMQVLRGPDNEYKSAVETFVNSEMSENNRYQITVLVDELWQHVINNIAQERQIDIDTLNQIANQLSLQQARDAVQHQLIDGLRYHDEVKGAVKKAMQVGPKKEVPAIGIEDYAMLKNSQSKLNELANRTGPNKLAVIYADGDIMSGENDRGIVGSRTTALAIRQARENDQVKAIVLRVNSPGGSALASDVILREVFLSSKSKPTLVSFGNVAASGGYYIAAAADKIFAEPNTITGSIGVFSLLPNMENFFNKKLGIYFENVNTNEYSDFGNISQALKPYEKQVLQAQLENVYQTFKAHVADGRSLTPEQVEKIAKGRVWSGKAAKEIGLVDELGGLQAAIHEAAGMAKLHNYKILKLPREDSPFNRFLKNADEGAKSWLLHAFFGEAFLPLFEQQQKIHLLSKTKGVQARMPFELTID